jgi:L-erythro-3,5-diaminohexanoate dehydrogenase
MGKRLGADRVLEPAGALPQGADRLDASGPVREYEFEVAVEHLCLDSTSFHEVRRRVGGKPEAMAARILEIVGGRGKMHNPATDSGGILTGTVEAVGPGYGSPPAPGERIATLGSLTLTPLRLESVTHVDPDSPQVEVEGAAYVCDRAPWAPLPGDLSLQTALEIFDVCAAASHTRELAAEAGTVCVLGAGHAGKLVAAAARDVMRGGTVAVVDIEAEAIASVAEHGLADVGIVADLRDPLAALDAVHEAGVGPADLTVVVVNAAGCEPAAVLLTAERGTAIFFSMATSFSAAALVPDGTSSDIRIVVGTGYAPDRGVYALELVRRSEPLRRALGLTAREPA